MLSILQMALQGRLINTFAHLFRVEWPSVPSPPSSEFVLLVGAVLVVLGTWLLIRHRRRLAGQLHDQSLAPEDADYLRRQNQRRQKTSILLIVLGVMIPAGDLLLERMEQPEPVTVTIYWIGVLLLVLYMIWLAAVELFVTGLHTRDALARVRSQQAVLENDLKKLRESLDRGDSDQP